MKADAQPEGKCIFTNRLYECIVFLRQILTLTSWHFHWNFSLRVNIIIFLFLVVLLNWIENYCKVYPSSLEENTLYTVQGCTMESLSSLVQVANCIKSSRKLWIFIVANEFIHCALCGQYNTIITERTALTNVFLLDLRINLR